MYSGRGRPVYDTSVGGSSPVFKMCLFAHGLFTAALGLVLCLVVDLATETAVSSTPSRPGVALLVAFRGGFAGFFGGVGGGVAHLTAVASIS